MKNVIVLSPAILFLFLAGCAASKEFSPSGYEREIVTAEQWGGTPAVDSLARKHSIVYITLHHAGVPFPEGKDIIQYMRNLQNWSRSEKKWIDLPYHYVIGLDGTVYQGRDLRYAGDTNTEYDPAGHALIEVVGNFEEAVPNEKQLDAVVKTMAMLSIRYNVPVDSIRAHRDYSAKTVCPGKNLYEYMRSGFFREKVSETIGIAKK